MSDPITPPAQKTSKGCWFQGCVVLAVAGVIGAIVLFFGARYLYREAQEFVAQYTETSAAPLQPVTLPEPERKALRERVDAFGNALRKPDSGQAELSLTGDELNALLQDLPQGAAVAQRIRVKIQRGVVSGTVSWPLNTLPGFQGSNRYLNGEADIHVGLTNGLLHVSIADFRFHGVSLPASAMAGLRAVNFAEGLEKDPQASDVLRRFDTLEVRGDRLVLRTRP